MVLAKLGVVYHPAYLLVFILVTIICATLLLPILRRPQVSGVPTRLMAALLVLASAVVQALAFLRFEADPLYLQGIYNQQTYYQFLVAVMLSAISSLAALVITGVVYVHHVRVKI